MPQDGKTPVLINLMAIASYDGMPDYPIQFMTRGTLHFQNSGNAVLSYKESQQDDESGETIESDIILNIGEKQVTMERRGDFANTLVFVPGHRYEGTYQTPYGELGMAVFPRKVDCRIGEKKGAVHLRYQLDIHGSFTSTNELHLEYNAEAQEGNGLA